MRTDLKSERQGKGKVGSFKFPPGSGSKSFLPSATRIELASPPPPSAPLLSHLLRAREFTAHPSSSSVPRLTPRCLRQTRKARLEMKGFHTGTEIMYLLYLNFNNVRLAPKCYHLSNPLDTPVWKSGPASKYSQGLWTFGLPSDVSAILWSRIPIHFACNMNFEWRAFLISNVRKGKGRFQGQ